MLKKRRALTEDKLGSVKTHTAEVTGTTSTQKAPHNREQPKRLYAHALQPVFGICT
jgi:hypothetical protein